MLKPNIRIIIEDGTEKHLIDNEAILTFGKEGNPKDLYIVNQNDGDIILMSSYSAHMVSFLFQEKCEDLLQELVRRYEMDYLEFLNNLNNEKEHGNQSTAGTTPSP